jgi:hypothetical protein
MRWSTRVAAAVGLAVLMVAGGCGGGDGGSPRLTLTDDDCTYKGDKAPTVGALSVEVENKSSTDGSFELYSIAPGWTFADLEADVEKERQSLADGVVYLGLPDFVSLTRRVGIASGESGVLGSEVTTGKYVLMCYREPHRTAFYVATRLEVSE